MDCYVRVMPMVASMRRLLQLQHCRDLVHESTHAGVLCMCVCLSLGLSLYMFACVKTCFSEFLSHIITQDAEHSNSNDAWSGFDVAWQVTELSDHSFVHKNHHTCGSFTGHVFPCQVLCFALSDLLVSAFLCQTCPVNGGAGQFTEVLRKDCFRKARCALHVNSSP